MTSSSARGVTYKLVLRGELSDRFGSIFAGMNLEQLAGMTVLTGPVVDQTQLIGLIERAHELGIDLVSVEPLDQGPVVGAGGASDWDGDT